MLHKDTGIPLHVQLADVLRQQIILGELAPDQQISSERVLCEKYGVSRITVRHAFGILNQEGLITTVQGKGTYVTPQRLEERLQSLNGFSKDMRRATRKNTAKNKAPNNNDKRNVSTFNVQKPPSLIVKLCKLSCKYSR